MKINIEDITLDQIQEFLETGSVENAPENFVAYLKVLEAMHGMFLRIRHYGTKEAILKHVILTHPELELSPYKANNLYSDMIEYFYADTEISAKAWRNLYATRVDRLATATEIIATDEEGFDRASRMWVRAYKMRGLDQPEPPEIPKEAFAKPIKVYVMDPTFLGEEKINRLEVAKQIDELELTGPQKLLLKQDAGIEPIKLFDNEQEELRKPER